MKIGTAVKGLTIGGIVFFVGRYFFNLKRAEQKVAVQIGGRVHRFTTQGVEFIMDYNVKNPTASVMEMAIPLIKLFHNGSLLASSTLTPISGVNSKGRIPIGAYSETGTISSKILIPYLSMIGLGTDLVKVLKARFDGGTTKVKFIVEVNTTIFTRLANIPYDESQTIEI